MGRVLFDHVYKRFGKVEVVHDINLDIKDKEFLVLVGPSGCGKSTCLRMVAGLEDLSEGEIFIGEKLVNGVAPKDRDIAMVFQNYALYPHMTVYDNMAFGLKLHHFPKDQITKRVDEAAEILGLQPLLKRKPKELSGGQRQRVALGRAIVREPQVFDRNLRHTRPDRGDDDGVPYCRAQRRFHPTDRRAAGTLRSSH